MFKKLLRKEEGFTMVEMMVVLIIIAVLIGAGIRFYFGYIENSRVTKAKAQVGIMQAALDSYFAEKGVYSNGTDAATLREALTNAGIKALTTDAAATGVKTKLNEKDPWGVEYVYEYDATNKDCEVYTGYNKIQKPGSDYAYIVGRCDKGESTILGIEKRLSTDDPITPLP
jgi:general secretion pathway protein G